MALIWFLIIYVLIILVFKFHKVFLNKRWIPYLPAITLSFLSLYLFIELRIQVKQEEGINYPLWTNPSITTGLYLMVVVPLTIIGYVAGMWISDNKKEKEIKKKNH
ncbi:hypothetical protein [Bacillus massiliigorillae]|uniref:hypothetical protein n=1 Tax=Bacillus massiliigorillae TaxID=1243664 RepID=UPI0005A614F8|nr:hypothetical protein [Bacillus massiliigorillae]